MFYLVTVLSGGGSAAPEAATAAAAAAHPAPWPLRIPPAVAATQVQEFLHVKPGKGSAFVRSKLKNLMNGNTLEKTWKAGESFPDAQVDRESMTFTYIDGDDHVFMNMETYEEERCASLAVRG